MPRVELSPVLSSFTRTSLSLLLVEDDPADAETLRERLAGCRSAHFRVARAESLAEALTRLRGEATDVVLLDLHLPDASGMETCERFLDAAAGVPFVVLTGVDDEALGIEAVRRGAQDFLVKGPMGPEALGRTLRYAVERHAMLARLDRAAREARANEANLRRLLERSVEGLVVVDGEGAVRFANRSAQELLGRGDAEVLGRPWATLSEAGACGPSATAQEVLLSRPNRPPAPVETRVMDVEWEGRPARLVSLLDLTDRRRAERIAVASEVQRTFLPERAGVRAGDFEAEALNELCEDVSGDFYDFFRLDDGRLVVAVGDVSGHGLGAAFLMCQARAFVRAFCRSRHDPASVMAQMNHALDEAIRPGTFLTLFLAFIDPADGTLEWSSAGHVPALVRRAATGRVDLLRANAPPLWVMPGTSIPAAPPTRLDEGDVLLLCTDGATEAEDPAGRRFGLERLAAALSGGPSRTAPLVAEVRSALRAWTGPGPVHDDLTLVAVRRSPPGEEAPAAPPSRRDPPES